METGEYQQYNYATVALRVVGPDRERAAPQLALIKNLTVASALLDRVLASYS